MSRSSSSSRSSGVCFGVFGASSSAEACGFGVFGASSSAEACGFGVFGASSSAEACGFGVFGASSSAEALVALESWRLSFHMKFSAFESLALEPVLSLAFELLELSLQVKAGSLNQLLLEKPPCSEVLAPLCLVFRLACFAKPCLGSRSTWPAEVPGGLVWTRVCTFSR